MKKPRSNSAEAAVAALVNVAKGPIHPPAHVRLREGDEPFWLGVVCARARALRENDLHPATLEALRARYEAQE